MKFNVTSRKVRFCVEGIKAHYTNGGFFYGITMFNDEAKELLEHISKKWDSTENLAKTAENITGDALGAVMFEFRYAGRKLVDTVRVAISENPSIEKIRDLVFAT